MTDPAKFENLVRAALPTLDARFESLSPTGVGLNGKTVADPADGFGLAWSDEGPAWVGMGCTTQQTGVASKLEGDYEKLVQQVPEDPSQEPRAVVALACNTSLGSSQVEQLSALGLEDKVKVEAVDVGRLADILAKPENHWIGHSFLDVSPRFANDGSLRQASNSFLESLEAPLFGQPGSMPESPSVDELDDALQFPFIELVGASGQGKTATALQLGRRVREGGGIVVHLAETIVDTHSSLSGAIDEAFEKQGWQFEDSPGRFIEQGGSSKEVLVVVDDIERLNSTQRALDRVESWARQLRRTPDVDVSLLCTRWPRKGDLQQAAADEPSRVLCSPPSQDALVAYAEEILGTEDVPVSEYDAKALVENLGEDPLLLGIYSETTQEPGDEPTYRDVWEDLVDQGIHHASDGRDLSPMEIRGAWKWLGDCVLRDGTLPKRADLLKDAKEEGHRRALVALLESGRLVRPAGSAVRFRHDRLRDWHIGSRILAHHSRGTIEDVWSARWDPYFNQAIGDAVVQSGYDDSFLSLVTTERPEALFGTLHAAEIESATLEAMEEWVEQNRGDWLREPGVEFAVQSIVGVHHPNLGPVLAGLPDWPAVLLARMAHGDTRAALAMFRSGLGVNDPARDGALEAGLERYEEELTGGLRQMLENNPEEGWTNAAIDLASSLRASGLAGLVRGLYDGDPELLDHAICFEYLTTPDNYEEHGEELLREWLKLRNERDSDEHAGWKDGIRFGLANGPVTKEATEALTEALLDLGAAWEGAHILHDVRTPHGVTATVRLFAEYCRKQEDPRLAFQSVRTMLFGQFAEQLQRIPPHPEERSALLALAMDADDDMVQKVATWVYLMDPQPGDLDDVKSLQAPWNEAQAILARAKLGDPETIPWIREKAWEWPHYITWLVHVWGPEARACFEDWLDQIIDSFHAGELEEGPWREAKKVLLEIPRSEAPEILEERISRLPATPGIVQAALCLESSVLEGWAIDQIQGGPQPSPLLKRIFSAFGSDEDGPLIPIDAGQVKRWKPILDYFATRELGGIYRICLRGGEEDWIRPRVKERLRDYDRKRLCPTREDLEEELHSAFDREHPRPGKYLTDNPGTTSEELLAALEEVTRDRDLEDDADLIEWPLRYWCNRDTLAEFWELHPPTGPRSRLAKKRTTYHVATQHPPQ